MRNLLIILVAFVLAQNWQFVWAWANGDLGYQRAVHGEVVLLSTKTCSYCRKTRRYLDLRQVPFTEYDVETSAQGYRLYQQVGAHGVPVLIVGEEVVQGFRPTRFERAFAQRAADAAVAEPAG